KEMRFIGVQSLYYWSSTEHESDFSLAWGAYMGNSSMDLSGKGDGGYVWPVHGDN
ncbi:unnamed protein product, partial [marine sediment metagenome]